MNKLLIFGLVFLMTMFSAFGVLTDAELYYSFDDADNSGSNPTDISGNGHTGTNNGATTGATGKVLEAFDFDGTNDYVSATSFQVATGSFSINVWANSDAWESGNRAIIDVDNTGQHFYIIDFSSSAGITTQVNDGSDSVTCSGGAGLSAGWHMITLVWDEATNTMTQYIDGSSVCSDTDAAVSITDITSEFFVGAISNPLYYFNGRIDEAALYQRTLSTSEITELYNSGDGLNPYDATPEVNPFTLYANNTFGNVSLSQFRANITVNGSIELSARTTNTSIPFNETYDFSGNNRTLTNSGATYVDGHFDFTTGDYLSSTWLPVEGSGARTVIVAINVTDNSTTQDGSLFSYGTRADPEEFTLRLEDGKTRFQWSGGSVVGTGVRTNEMQTVSAQYSGTNLSIYKNGLYDTSVDVSLDTGNTYGLQIGRRAGTGLDFDGAILWIKVFDEALSASEIFDESQNESIIYWDGLIGYYPFLRVMNTSTVNVTGYTVDRYPFTELMFNTANDLTVNLTQSYASFAAYEVMSNSTLSGSVTVQGDRVNTGVPLGLEAGTHLATFNKTGYFDKNYSFSPAALTNQTYNIYDIGTAKLNVYAQIIDVNTTITNYTVTLYNGNYTYTKQINTTSGVAAFDVLQSQAYNLTFTSSDYATSYANVTINSTTTVQNYTFNAYQTNSVAIFVRDEVTGQIIDEALFTLDFISVEDSFSINTSNGTAFQGLITPSDYEIRYYSTDNDDFKLRSYFFTLVNASFNTINLYALNESSGNITNAQITFQVFDADFQPVENALIVVKRYFLDQNGYVTVYERFTNTNGQAVGTFETVDAFYQYQIFFNDELKYTSPDEGTQFAGDEVITKYIDTTTSFVNIGYDISRIPHTLIYENLSNTTGYFQLNYTNPNNYRICLQVRQGIDTNETCQVTTSGTIQISVTGNTLQQQTFFATATALDNGLGNKVAFGEASKTFFLQPLDSQDVREAATFTLVLILLGIGLALIKWPLWSIIAQTTVFGVVALVPFQLINIGGATAGFLFAIMLVILLSLKNRNGR